MNEKFMKLCKDYNIDFDIYFNRLQERWIIHASRFNRTIDYTYCFSEAQRKLALFDVWDEAYRNIYENLVGEVNERSLTEWMKEPEITYTSVHAY